MTVRIKEEAVRVGVFGDPNILAEIEEHFAFKVPDAFRSPSHDIWIRSGGKMGWDGMKRPFKTKGSAGLLPRGHLPDLLAYLKRRDIDISSESEFIHNPFSKIVADDLPAQIIEAEFEMDESQKECVAALCKAGHGIAYVTVSGGKTAILLEAAAVIRTQKPKARVLYITPAERLVSQVYKEAKKFLPDWDITQYGGKIKDISGKDLVVCTTAMVSRNILKLKKWLSTFDIILADECHHFTSDSGRKIIINCPAQYRLAASDTLKQDDIVKHTELIGLFGPVLIRMKAEALINSGRLATPYIYLIDLPPTKEFTKLTKDAVVGTNAWAWVDGVWHKGVYRGPVYREDDDGEILLLKGEPVKLPGYHLIEIDGDEVPVDSSHCLLERLNDKAIIRYKARNEMATRWVKYFAVDRGLRTLVVATRTIHVMILKSLLSKVIPADKLRVLVGTASTKERDATLEWVKKTPGCVLISPLIKEGVSINELEAGVIADRIADWEYAKQIIGRFVRKKKKGPNEAHIAWFYDRQHRVFKKSATALFDRLSEEARGFKLIHPVTEPGTEHLALQW